MGKVDVRVPVDAAGREVRVSPASVGADTGKLVGYAAVFNKRSVRLLDFYEVVMPGAFKRALSGQPDVRALLNHDPNWVLGRTRSGTLALAEDGTGLLATITPPDAQWARDLVHSVQRGDIDQMSFAFRVMPGGEQWRMEGKDLIRELTDIEVYDVSAVTYPAYPDTTLGTRAEVRSVECVGSGEPPTVRMDNMRRRLALAEVE